MVLQWATKRLLKFLLKRLNRFLYDEIDVEQLDVQLGSGIGELRELILNAEYISDQLKGLPVILKSGCITRIVVRLPCEIEVDGLELTVAPRQPGDQAGAEFRPTSTSSEDVDVDGGTNGYSGVSDGVRVVGQIIKSWLLGLRVKLTRVSIRIEGGDDHLTLSIPSLEYGYEDSKEDNGDVEKVVKLTNVNVEAGDQQVGLFGEKGVTSRIRIGVFGARTTPKIALDVGVESACFRASVESMKQLVSVTSVFMNGNTREENGSVYHDTCSFYDQGLKSVMIDTPKCSLPIISYWMRKPELSEPELDASMDEFFECLDQTAANSGLWQWTCTALGAASSSGATLTPEAIHVEYSINARLESLYAVLLYDECGEGLELVVKDVNVGFSQELKVHIHDIEVNQLQPSTSQRECFSRLAQTVFPRCFVHQGLSEDLEREKVQLLKVSSSSEEPAVVMLSKNRGTRTNFSVSFQPLVVWFDDGVLEKMAAFLAQLHVSSPSHPTDAVETVEENNRMLEVRLPAIKAFFSAAGKCRGIVAVHLEAASAIRQGKRKELMFSVAEGFVDVICGPSPLRVLSLIGRASCELNWKEHYSTSPSVAKKSWDSIAVQAKSVPGSTNADFAWATNLRADTRHSVLDMLKATSALRVNVLLSNVGLDLSTPDHVAALELLSQFGPSSSDSEVSHSDNDFASQTVVLLSAREAVVGVSNALRLRVTSLKITTALALGGDASASLFQLSHVDGCLTEGDSEVLSCKGNVIGRGDGGCSNVLSTGSAGLALTVVSWPGREQLADCLVTGHMNGGTLVTEGGAFGWLPVVMNFFDQCSAPFQKNSDDPPAESSSRTYFHFDLHDVALRYEPSVDSQVPSSIGCVLAASSFRVSSGEGADAGTSFYYIASRELGLQLIDRKLRQFVQDAKSLQPEGYVKVAGAPVLSAMVKVDSQRWVVESFENQLHFDSCSDTTAAFGQLVSDIQRLFAPEIPETDEVSQVPMKMREAESVQAEEEFEDEDTEDANELFKGLVENAFTVCKRTTASCSASQTAIQHEVIEQSDSPVIEDYYLFEKLSKVREQGSRHERPGGINDSEATGGWYEEQSVDVMESHVPVGRGRISKKASSPSSSQPQPTGKLVLTGWKITWKLYEGSDWQAKRSSAKCVEVSVSGLDLQYDSFAPTGLLASSLILEVHDVRVYDCGENAPWMLILGYYDKVSRPRESTSKAVKFRMDTVRPNPSAGLEEYRISLAFLPIRVHLDQDHLDFFTRFFSSDNDVEEVACVVVNNAMLPFFQVCEMRALVIRVDYVPRRLNFGALREGNLVELLNLCSWKGVELQLNPVHTSGVYGWSSLTGLVLGQWLEEISVHQIPLYLKCAAPIRPMCAIGSGAAKLFILPAKQYKKDKRFFKGIRKGAIAFVQSLSLEALSLGANLAGGAHHILSQTEVALGGEKRDAKRKKPPSGPCEGLKQAYESLTQGLEKTAVALVSNPVKAYQRGEGAGVAVASAIRASPTAILAPASAAAQAVRHTLLGVRNGLDPERRRERADERRR